MDLVILAGGIGSRFGGLKQIEPIDDDGNFIIDYSVFDAIRAGFNRIVFVIRKETLNDFKNTIGKRLENKIKVEYVFQNMDSFVDKKYNLNKRTKPWGTAHAILCAKDVVKQNFAIVNADDFYGKTSFSKIYKFLKQNKSDNKFCMVGYKIGNTLSQNGDVKRAICSVNNGKLINLTESVIRSQNNKLLSCPLNNALNKEQNFEQIEKNILASMNLFGFTPKVFSLLEQGFYNFLEENKNNLETCEYFIPSILTKNIKAKKIDISVIPTNEKWLGLTYKTDYEVVKQGIKNLKNKKIYPIKLWEN